MYAELLCSASDRLAEGPIWDHRLDRLLWFDIERGIVHSWCERDGLQDVLQTGGWIGAMALVQNEDLLLATSEGIVQWSTASGKITPLADPLAGQRLRFNDGRVDAMGRFWLGTMTLDPNAYSEPHGLLFCFDPMGSVKIMERGLTICNGMDWSPDLRTFYLTDSMHHCIFAYDFDADTGSISNRRVFVSLPPQDGTPDGLVVDALGYVWSANFRGSHIARYDPDGVQISRIMLPVSRPTALAFGGQGLAQAFITSALVTNNGFEEALSGGVFSIPAGVSGLCQNIFAL